MEEERRPGGRRERSRPSKAAFTPPEEEPAAAPPPRRPPASGPVPSVLFQAPEVPDETPDDETPWPAPPAKRSTPDTPIAAPQTRARPDMGTTPDTRPAPTRPAKRATRDAPTAAPPAQTRPAKQTTQDSPTTTPPAQTQPAKRTGRDAPAAGAAGQTRPAKRANRDAAAAEPPAQAAKRTSAGTAETAATAQVARKLPAEEIPAGGTEDRPRSRPAKKAAAGEPAAKAPKKTAAKKAAKKAAAKATATAAATAARKAVALVSGSVVARTTEEDGPATTPRLLDRPGHAPELLALAAVRAIGPQARDWVALTRATYPAATDDGLARLAARRFVRMAGAGGAVSAAFGLLTPMAELTATAWAQAALVLHLAAVYGRDPLDAERAVELLVLVGAHSSPEVARAALAEATAADTDVDGPPALRAAEAAWRLVTPLSGQSRGWLAVRMVARRLPGVVPVTAAVGAAAAVERLGYRARAHYRAV